MSVLKLGFYKWMLKHVGQKNKSETTKEEEEEGSRNFIRNLYNHSRLRLHTRSITFIN
jgi:hypothetical protein